MSQSLESTDLNPHINTDEIARFVKKYYLGKTIVENKKHIIAKAQNLQTGQTVCIKSMNFRTYKKLKEAQLLRRLRNVPGVIQFLDQFYIHKHGQIIVTEYFGTMNLQELLNLRGGFSDDACHKITCQLMSAIQHCSKKNVLHRHIKMSNIRINATSLQLKLINFSSACQLHKGYSHNMIGQLCKFHAPPEFHKYYCYHGDKLNVWTLGLILYELILNQKPFTSFYQIKYKSCSHICTNENVPPFLAFFIDYALTKNPCLRPSMSQLSQHPWITKKR